MRILHVNNINQVAKIYASELTRRGHIVSVYEPSLSGGSAALPIKLAMMPGRILDLRNIIDNLNEKHFDIVHIHWASYGLLGLVSRIPYILQCHGSDVRHRLKQPFFRQVLSTFLQRAAAVLCITPDLIPIVRAVRSDVIFSPGPIDTEQFVPGENTLQHLSRPWTITLFARLDAEKGVETAIQGIVRFANRHPDIQVQLLDHGPQKEEYRQRYGSRFEFYPFLAASEVPRFLQATDVVVGQLASGALGLSELQAMSCAKPLIASFRYEDSYATAPPLCQATTPEEVDEHLEYLFQYQEAARALGSKARAWVVKNHNYQALAGKLENLYQSIL
jgi:glycosyltransferase involved in cell wall biosynthesis